MSPAQIASLYILEFTLNNQKVERNPEKEYGGGVRHDRRRGISCSLVLMYDEYTVSLSARGGLQSAYWIQFTCTFVSPSISFQSIRTTKDNPHGPFHPGLFSPHLPQLHNRLTADMASLGTPPPSSSSHHSSSIIPSPQSSIPTITYILLCSNLIATHNTMSEEKWRNVLANGSDGAKRLGAGTIRYVEDVLSVIRVRALSWEDSEGVLEMDERG
jgi:hypothetical protein